MLPKPRVLLLFIVVYCVRYTYVHMYREIWLVRKIYFSFYFRFLYIGRKWLFISTNRSDFKITKPTIYFKFFFAWFIYLICVCRLLVLILPIPTYMFVFGATPVTIELVYVLCVVPLLFIIVVVVVVL